MEHCRKYRCGEWATTIAEQIMEDVKEFEDPKSEAYLRNFVELVYDTPRMDIASRKCMVELANQIKESHAKQVQNEREKEPRASGNTITAEPVRNCGAFLTLYNPNRPGINQVGEAIWIDLGVDGRMLDMRYRRLRSVCFEKSFCF